MTRKEQVLNGIDENAYTETLVNKGNSYRIAELMKKAENGGEYTVMVFGGSISQGAGAGEIKNSYGYLVKEWWTKSFPKAKFNYINSGLGSTNPEMACYRYNDDVKKYSPDFVIISFSVNTYLDNNLSITYPTLLSRLIDDGAAVMSIYFSRTVQSEYKKGNFVKDESIPDKSIADSLKAYGIPTVDFHNYIWNKFEENLFLWNDVGYDWIHPNIAGHKIAASLICDHLEAVKANILSHSTPTDYPLLKDKSFLAAFMISNISPEATENGCFEKITGNEAVHGWRCNTGSGTLTVTLPEKFNKVSIFISSGSMKGEIKVSDKNGELMKITSADAITPTLLPVDGINGNKLTLSGEITENSAIIYGIAVK